MKLYFSVTKKILVCLTAAFCLFIFIFGRFAAAKNAYKNGDTNAKRVYFASTVNLDVKEQANFSKRIIITEELSREYNLNGYIGCQAVLYNYDVKEEDKALNLIVYKGRIIGCRAAPRALT
ncbi:MAG: hypothetical protein IJZ75_04350 [Clostridia bacterium]|nr:hypothetical protein [Clostridia bacterium]